MEYAVLDMDGNVIMQNASEFELEWFFEVECIDNYKIIKL